VKKIIIRVHAKMVAQRIRSMLLVLTSLFIMLYCSSFQSSWAAKSENESKQTIAQEVEKLLKTRENLFSSCKIIEEDKIRNAFRQIDAVKIMATKESWTSRQTMSLFLAIVPRLLHFHSGLNYKHLVLATPHDAPKLCRLVTNLAQQLSISTPLIFIVDDDTFINACSGSFTQNYSMIAIGKQLLTNFSHEELKSTIAHELGHIKLNHGIKITASLILTTAGIFLLTDLLLKLFIDFNNPKSSTKRTIRNVAIRSGQLLTSTILAYNILAPYFRKIEKDADNIELSITNDPEALNNSLKTMTQLEQQQFNKYLQEQLTLWDHIDKETGKISPDEAKELKQNLASHSLGSLISNFLFSPQTHPSHKQRYEYVNSIYKCNELFQ
jgi:Zn-dependent protease with chaperone function